MDQPIWVHYDINGTKRSCVLYNTYPLFWHPHMVLFGCIIVFLYYTPYCYQLCDRKVKLHAQRLVERTATKVLIKQHTCIQIDFKSGSAAGSHDCMIFLNSGCPDSSGKKYDKLSGLKLIGLKLTGISIQHILNRVATFIEEGNENCNCCIKVSGYFWNILYMFKESKYILQDLNSNQ